MRQFGGIHIYGEDMPEHRRANTKSDDIILDRDDDSENLLRRRELILRRYDDDVSSCDSRAADFDQIQSNKRSEQKRTYAMRLELTEHGIVWRRPEYVPSWKPEKSGDLDLHTDPDEGHARLQVLPSKWAMDEVDDITKKLLSLLVAMLTVKIRNLQRATFQWKKNTQERVRLLELIDRRKKLLKNLRRMDYRCFEWLLEELNILYRPFPRSYKWITRKDSLKRLVKMHGEDLRKNRLEAYQAALELQKEPFLKEKAETLQWIAETETSLGLPVSVTLPQDPTPTVDSTLDSE
nr:28S ribosomal protein S15, mitochondrial-like [Cherax quadricarinatus]